MKVEDEQISVSDAVDGGHQPVDQIMPVGVSPANVGSFATSRKHHRKRSHDGMSDSL